MAAAARGTDLSIARVLGPENPGGKHVGQMKRVICCDVALNLPFDLSVRVEPR
jgi:hypothetical protein